MILVGLFTIFVNYFVLITRNNIVVTMTADSQNLLRSVVEELRYGAGVRQANTITDPNGPAGGWSTSNGNFVIIIAVPAVNSTQAYIIDPDTVTPYKNELVYYKDGTSLYKRVLAHPDATGNTLTTTCPPASASSTCPADRKLVDNVNDMEFILYDQDNALTTDPLLARSLKINVDMLKDSFGQPLVVNNSIGVTLRNRF
jgi:hypothetical protein